jgi:RNA 2',3'-cyclic 3'-phosphodiesterase
MAAEQQRIAASLGPAGASLKWVAPDRAHLTLVFLGHVDAMLVPPIVAAMEQDVNVRPFDVTFGGLGTFPLHGAPRVLWVGIEAGISPLRALQRDVASRVAAHGIAIEAREFHPHLTLGRWTSSRSSDRARGLGAARNGAIAGEHVARVTLYQSRLSSSGAAYAALAHANLTGT